MTETPCPDAAICPLFRKNEPCRPDEIERCVEYGIRLQIKQITEEYEEETGYNRTSHLADKMNAFKGFCSNS